jgi:Uncharacterized conserved protein (COG2071)
MADGGIPSLAGRQAGVGTPPTTRAGARHVDGSGWLGLTPFRVPRFSVLDLRAVPLVSSFNETNLRTYVRRPDGQDGRWFFRWTSTVSSTWAVACRTSCRPCRCGRMTGCATGVGERDVHHEPPYGTCGTANTLAACGWSRAAHRSPVRAVAGGSAPNRALPARDLRVRHTSARRFVSGGWPDRRSDRLPRHARSFATAPFGGRITATRAGG